MTIAVPGLGHPHGAAYVESLADLEEVTSVLIAEPNRGWIPRSGSEKIQTVAHLDRPISGIDGVLIADTPSRIPVIARGWIGLGIPVLVEKPGARTSPEFKRLALFAQEHGTVLSVSYPLRCHPVAEAISNHVLSGDLGRITGFEARWLASRVGLRDPDHWLFDGEASGGGILHWLGCHLIDLVMWTTGQSVSDVGCIAGILDGEKIDVEDTAVLSLRLSGGALGTLRTGYQLPESAPGYIHGSYDSFFGLNGTNGWVRWDFKGTESHDGAGTYRINGRTVRLDVPEKPGYSGGEGWLFLRRWLHSIRDGIDPPVQAGDGLKVLQTIDAAYLSNAKGLIVEI